MERISAVATHRCAAIGCYKTVDAKYFMCMEHWKMVPKALQDEVLEAHRKRGPKLDASWAPWVRAKGRASAAIYRWSTPLSKELWLKHTEDVACDLERE